MDVWRLIELVTEPLIGDGDLEDLDSLPLHKLRERCFNVLASMGQALREIEQAQQSQTFTERLMEYGQQQLDERRLRGEE